MPKTSEFTAGLDRSREGATSWIPRLFLLMVLLKAAVCVDAGMLSRILLIVPRYLTKHDAADGGLQHHVGCEW